MFKNLESKKLEYDTYKHLTTLSTGSIILLATFVEKLFDAPEWSILAPVAIGFFMLSVVSSVTSMFGISYELNPENIDQPISEKLGTTITIGSCGGFLCGVFTFVVFAIKNLI